MLRSTSRRTASPKRRRRRLRSMAASRSSASPSSRSRSASRVTRKVECDSTSMPGNSSPRRAAMICSRGTKRSPSGRATKRGSSGGTFTRAKRRSPVRGLRTSTARFSDRLEMWGKGWPGSTASGVSTGKMRWSKTSSRNSRSSSPICSQPHMWMPASASTGRTRVAKIADCWSISSATRMRMARSCSVGVSPSGDVPPSRAACCSLRMATRTWKNSSRLLAKMARNLARSRTGVSSTSAWARTRWLNSSQLSSRLR